MIDDSTWYAAAVERIGGGDPFRWFLAQLKPNCLSIATQNLDRQGFKSFVPLEQRTQRSGPRFKTVARPLFPGYVFVSLDTSMGQWRAVNSTYGITKLVAFGGKPAAVPQGLVEQIALGCDADGLLLPPEELLPGDKVLIQSGPFAGELAEIEHTDPNRRVWILLDLMGQKTRVHVTRDALKRG